MLKVLLPLDGSPCSEILLNWVYRFFTNQQKVVFYLIHVVGIDPMVVELPLSGVDYQVDAAKKLLKRYQDNLEAKGFDVAETQYGVGEPAAVICEYADRIEADQIVMGSHGHQGLAQVLLGSVSQSVFKQAKQPVIILNTGKKPSIQISQHDTLSVTEAIH